MYFVGSDIEYEIVKYEEQEYHIFSVQQRVCNLTHIDTFCKRILSKVFKYYTRIISFLNHDSRKFLIKSIFTFN